MGEESVALAPPDQDPRSSLTTPAYHDVDHHEPGPELHRIDEDYLATWPPRAQQLLRAARRLLVKKGFDALRWEAIAKEAGVQKSLIRYYFGDTTGLLRALLRLVSQDATLWLVDKVEAMPDGPARLRSLVYGSMELIKNAQYLAFLDILPHALRDDKLRGPIVELYRWWREMDMRCLGVTPTQDNVKELEAISSLVVAAVDGIAIQSALDPEGYDPAPAFAKLEQAIGLLLGPYHAAVTPPLVDDGGCT